MNSEKSSGEKNKQGREIGGMCVWKWERKLLNGNFLKTFIKFHTMTFIFFKNLFIYVFLAVLGLRCCMGFSPVAMSGGYSPVVERGL